MTIRVFLLHGGVFSIDGVVSSFGMNTLAHMLEPIARVKTYLWANWSQAYHDIVSMKDDKIVVVGYSGGGMKATWIANGVIVVGDKMVQAAAPRIDLLVAYDPSPEGSMQALHDNVKRAVCYHNKSPWMLGLGGGQLRRVAMSPLPLETIEIAEQHLAVQFDQSLHRRTVEEVRKLL